jgi:hypothetical protein
VQSVRPPHLLIALAAAVLVAAAAFALLTGGGDGSAAKPADKADTGYRRAAVKLDGAALQSARCKQWVAATPAERAAIVDVLGDVVGGPTPYGPAKALSADEATRLFDARCAHPYARGWLLYELYTRAAAFSDAMDRFQ